jgi:hypothetical protein
MVRRGWLPLLAVLVAASAVVPAQDETKKPDPPGTALYMARFRETFASWDRDKDGLLDKEELARAFRGPGAKPYDADKDKEATSCPDYNFLVQLDTDGDKKISRAEFEAWARDCSVQLKRYNDTREDIRQIQAGLARAANRAQKARLERELASARRTLSQVRDQLQKLQQHFRHAQKTGS